MSCSACGSETAPGAKFCAACGTRLAPEPPPANPIAAPVPAPPQAQAQVNLPGGQPLQLQVHVNLPPPAARRKRTRGFQEDEPGGPEGDPQRALTRQVSHALDRPARGLFCPSCGQRTMPKPYFARGLNIAKAAALFPLTAFGPILLFLIRKDRVVCGNCGALLPGEMHVPLIDTFNSAAPSLQGALMRRDGQALREREVVGQEIEHLEQSSRRRVGKAWSRGVVAAALAGAGGLMATTGDDAPFQAFFAMSGLAGVSAFVNGRRGKKESLEAQARRQRQRVLEILELARAHQGSLTVTLVASHMHLDFREAEALLDSMVDGRRVDVQVDDQGRMTYVFPELAP